MGFEARPELGCQISGPGEPDLPFRLRPPIQQRVPDAVGFRMVFTDQKIFPLGDSYQRHCDDRCRTLDLGRHFKVSPKPLYTAVHDLWTVQWSLHLRQSDLMELEYLVPDSLFENTTP